MNLCTEVKARLLLVGPAGDSNPPGHRLQVTGPRSQVAGHRHLHHEKLEATFISMCPKGKGTASFGAKTSLARADL